MEEIATFVFRLIGNVVFEIIIGTFFYWIGWPFVKLATLGKYPRKAWGKGSREEIYVSCVGVVAFSVAVMALLGQLSL